jgi:adenylate kinase
MSVAKSRLRNCRAQYLDIADFLSKSTHLLLGDPPKEQQEEVGEGIKKLAQKLPDADLNLIGLHASHLCYGIPQFPCSLRAIKQIEPDIFFTVFDDVYACHAKLRAAGYPYRYDLLLNWRMIECGIVDSLATAVGIDNLLLAAKHPAIAAYRLVFEPERPRVYSASQISNVRDNPSLRREIERHRRYLHKKYAVFDPLTIDDRVLVNRLRRCRGKIALRIPASDRWPCDLSDLGKAYRCLVPEDPGVFPVTVGLQEAKELNRPVEKRSCRNLIDAQITQRDFRYIDQSDVMAAYRPRLGGHESGGVAAEKTYAAGSGRTPVVEYTTPGDIKRFGSRPFSTPLLGPVCSDLKVFYRKLEAEAAREAQRRHGGKHKYYAKFQKFRERFKRRGR